MFELVFCFMILLTLVKVSLIVVKGQEQTQNDSDRNMSGLYTNIQNQQMQQRNEQNRLFQEQMQRNQEQVQRDQEEQQRQEQQALEEQQRQIDLQKQLQQQMFMNQMNNPFF